MRDPEVAAMYYEITQLEMLPDLHVDYGSVDVSP
jgi:hypothetical protein